MNAICCPSAILVAEDDAVAREVLCSVLARKYPKAVIHTAGDGKSGLESFRRHLPDLIITDIMMPEMDGIEMTRRILREKMDAKVIVVTGYRDLPGDDDSRLDELGVEAVLFKPLDFLALFAAISACCT